MQHLDASAFVLADSVPPPDRHSIHLWFCDHPPRADVASTEPNATANALLTPVLAHYPRMSSLALNRTPHGKPFFDAGNDLDFNLSHSGEHALIALAQAQAVGVDLERVGRKRSVLALARRFFCGSEFEALSALPEAAQSLAFLRLWTCKEAVLKALGRGIAFGLERLEFALDHNGTPTHLRSIASDGGDVADWQIIALQPAPDYLGALAWHGPKRNIQGYRIAPAATLSD